MMQPKLRKAHPWVPRPADYLGKVQQVFPKGLTVNKVMLTVLMNGAELKGSLLAFCSGWLAWTFSSTANAELKFAK